MIYVLRTYTAAPGRMEALNRRFADHTLALFRRHGFDLIGFWNSKADPDKLVYLVRFPDEETMNTRWNAFRADPDWKAVKAATEMDGPLTSKLEAEILEPTFYSAFLH